MSTSEIEPGDYVRYSKDFFDGIAMGREMGAGYVLSIKEGEVVVRNGDRYVIVPEVDCEIHAKQMRLEV